MTIPAFLESAWIDGLLIGLVAGTIVAVVQLFIAYRYIDSWLKKLAARKREETWSDMRLEFLACCLLTSWSVTRGLQYYLAERNGRLHMRQGIERALDEIIQKSASFNIAVGLALNGLSDRDQSQVSIIFDALSAAAGDAQSAKNKLERLATELPHIETIPDEAIDAYVVNAFGDSVEPTTAFARNRRLIAFWIAGAIEHILEAADELRTFAEEHADAEKVSLSSSRRYLKLIKRSAYKISVESDMQDIYDSLSKLKNDLDTMMKCGLCFAMINEVDVRM